MGDCFSGQKKYRFGGQVQRSGVKLVPEPAVHANIYICYFCCFYLFMYLMYYVYIYIYTIGWLYDVTGSYTRPMYIWTAICIFGGSISVLEAKIRKPIVHFCYD